jgi:hypothetical protein
MDNKRLGIIVKKPRGCGGPVLPPTPYLKITPRPPKKRAPYGLLDRFVMPLFKWLFAFALLCNVVAITIILRVGDAEAISYLNLAGCVIFGGYMRNIFKA